MTEWQTVNMKIKMRRRDLHCLLRYIYWSAGLKQYVYSWLSLSRFRLSRITAYLEVKIWSLPKHENLTTDKENGVEKRRICS